MKIQDNYGETIAYRFDLLADEASENALIGAILSDGRYAYDRVRDIVRSDNFTSDERMRIFEAFRSLAEKGREIDLTTVAGEIGGSVSAMNIAGYVMEVTDGRNAESYAAKVADMASRRAMMEAILRINGRIRDTSVEADELLDEMIAQLRTIQDSSTVAGVKFRTIAEATQESVEAMNRRIDNRRNGMSVDGVTTGIRRLDNVIGGFKGGELIVLGARPAMGKTALMLHFARAAAKSGNDVCLFSLEMSSRELADRNLISVTGVNPDDFRLGELTQRDLDAVNAGIYTIRAMNMNIDETPSVTVEYIRRQSKKMKRMNRCDIIMVDYLQLIREDGRKDRNREQAVAAITRELKVLAKELDVPVILLAQLSRECERRADKKPELADLRESGAIEQDADMVMFLYRPSVYGLTGDDGMPLPNDLGYLLTSKNRRGATGAVKFWHNQSMTIINDYN